jgi:hypothetical protein
MASTTFIDNQTTIFADWLNDANNVVYNGIFQSPTITATSMVCTGTASGAGFTNLVNNTFASPAAIGSATPNTGSFTTLTATTLTAIGVTTPLPLKGTTSGTVSLAVPAVAGTNTITFPSGSGTVAVQGLSSNIVSGTAVASTSGTSIDFIGIPSWAKRITVMFSGVSANGTSLVQIQLGVSGIAETTGYFSFVSNVQTTPNTTRGVTATTGFILEHAGSTTQILNGNIVFSLLNLNTWTSNGSLYSIDAVNGNGLNTISGAKTLAGTLNMVRITTVNGTDTFNAGSINILYE